MTQLLFFFCITRILFQHKDHLSRYINSNDNDKIICVLSWLFYLYKENSYTCKDGLYIKMMSHPQLLPSPQESHGIRVTSYEQQDI